MISTNAIWLSFDVESTGPCPGLHAMLSIGVTAFVRHPQKMEWMDLSTFSANLQIPSFLRWDEETAEWWGQYEDAYSACRENLVAPEVAMRELCGWLRDLQQAEPEWKPLTWVAYPAAFDMPFLNYYMHRFAPEEWREVAKDDVMQRVACFDIGSAACGVLGISPMDVSKRRMPDRWKSYKNLTPHVALADALEQAALAKALLDEMDKRSSPWGVHARLAKERDRDVETGDEQE